MHVIILIRGEQGCGKTQLANHLKAIIEGALPTNCTAECRSQQKIGPESVEEWTIGMPEDVAHG